MEIRIYISRPAQLAELLRSEFDPELFSHCAYVKFLWHSRQKYWISHFATTWDNFWYRKWIEREEIKRKWGNVESEYISFSSLSHSISSFSLHFLILSPYPPFLIFSSFSHSLPICSKPGCQDATSCATLVCPNQSFRPPSWSSLPKVVDCLFVSPRHDGDGLVELEVTVNLLSPGVVIAMVALIPWACLMPSWGGLVVPLRLFLVILTLDVIPRPLLSRSSCTMSCHWAHRPVREKVQKGKTKHSPLLTYSSHLVTFLCETKRWQNSKYMMK